jgi:hypothetical protein
MWRTNAEQTAVWKKLEDGTYIYEKMIVCPHCHSQLSIYGGCKNCNKIRVFMETNGLKGV